MSAAPLPAPDARRYTTTAIVLHWTVALIVIAQIALGWYMVDLPKRTPAVAITYNLHKSIGIAAFALILARLAWRARHPAPALNGLLPAWQVRAATASHALLYLCMFLMPVSGFLASNFNRFGIHAFGIQIGPFFAEDKSLYGVFNGMHVATSTVFAILIAGHAAAALHHLFAGRAEVFGRMLPRRKSRQ